jgi:hypothetical protein
MSSDNRRTEVNRWRAAAVIVVAAIVFSAIGFFRLRRDWENPPPATPPVLVQLFVDPDQVDHRSRLRFSFDSPDVLEPLRREEGLDAVVAGASSDEDASHRLMVWTRAQFKPGKPSPYPPPDARIILRDIRAGVTGGFCAQYCFVLVQALQSYGVPARLVTIRGHEVVETWLRDEHRWVIFDPLYELQVFNQAGRSLNALEIRRSVEHAEELRLSDGHRLTETDLEYIDRYRRFAVWIRNDLVSRPMNFQDFHRYRVWFEPDGDSWLASESLTTAFEEDLYPRIGRPKP